MKVPLSLTARIRIRGLQKVDLVNRKAMQCTAYYIYSAVNGLALATKKQHI